MPEAQAVPEIRFVNGYRVPEREPVYSVHAPFGWRVTHPAGETDLTLTISGDMFWSSRFGQPFQLLDYVGDGVWNVQFPEEWEDRSNPDPWASAVTTTMAPFSGTIQWDAAEVLIDETPVDISEPEFTEYVYTRPFVYGNRYYVVMGDTDDHSDYEFEEGSVWYCEYEGSEYRLGRRVRESLFGSRHSFRISWIDPEDDYAIDDGYSVEQEDSSAVAVAPQVATNIGREVPLVSFEQEFSGNGDLVASRLYAAGYGLSRHADSYHNSNARYERDMSDSSAFCYVETDSSCGYELIFDRLQLRNRSQAERISQVQTILKGLKDEGHISLTARCGFHVHVDVSNWGMKEIVSAYHLWNYLEDPIFRFASAFWNSHRDEEVGGGYSSPVPKGHTNRRDIGRVLDGRRDALNFSPILNARTNCHCSAVMYEDWANCTCSVSQPTLEFRVFNATLNQRKIKAYLAFCIAFVNKVKNTEFDPVNFPEMRWLSTTRKSEVEKADGTFQSWDDAAIERVKFILNEFPLTGAEKSDINYCLRNSSLSPIMEWV